MLRTKFNIKQSIINTRQICVRLKFELLSNVMKLISFNKWIFTDA